MANKDLNSENQILSEEDENNDLNSDLVNQNESSCSLEYILPLLKENLEIKNSAQIISSKIHKDDEFSSAIINQKNLKENTVISLSSLATNKTNIKRKDSLLKKRTQSALLALEDNNGNKSSVKFPQLLPQSLENFDQLKTYIKYFPCNNASSVVYETNQKLYNLLKKKKKAYLFDKRWINEEYIATFDKTTTKTKGSSIRTKSLLRKNTKVAQNWKEVLKFAHKQKNQNKQKQRKFGYLNKIKSFFAIFFPNKKS